MRARKPQGRPASLTGTASCGMGRAAGTKKGLKKSAGASRLYRTGRLDQATMGNEQAGQARPPMQTSTAAML